MLFRAPSWGLWSPLSFVFDLLNCKKSWRNKQKRNISVPSYLNTKQSNKQTPVLKENGKWQNGKDRLTHFRAQRANILGDLPECDLSCWVLGKGLISPGRSNYVLRLRWCRLSPKTHRHKTFPSQQMWPSQSHLAISSRLWTPMKAYTQKTVLSPERLSSVPGKRHNFLSQPPCTVWSNRIFIPWRCPCFRNDGLQRTSADITRECWEGTSPEQILYWVLIFLFPQSFTQLPSSEVWNGTQEIWAIEWEVRSWKYRLI